MILNPLDGRYKNAVSELALLIGEDALILLRIKTECLYLLALADEGVVKLSRAQRNKILSFADGLLSGRLLMAGEESAGMSVTNWVTEKDGLLAVFLLLEIMSATGQDIAGLYKQLTELYGNPVYTRVDMPVTDEVKAKLKGFTEESLSYLKEVAGEKVLKIRTGDGVKVYLEESWFLVRPSGTEAIVKFYAETFKGEEHLSKILEEGKKVFGI